MKQTFVQTVQILAESFVVRGKSDYTGSDELTGTAALSRRKNNLWDNEW